MTTLVSPLKPNLIGVHQGHATDRVAAMPSLRTAGGVHHRVRPAPSPARPVIIPRQAGADGYTSIRARFMSFAGLFAGPAKPSGGTLSERQASMNRLAEYKTRAMMSYPRC